MDSIQPPTKPPRGVKNAKETVNLAYIFRIADHQVRFLSFCRLLIELISFFQSGLLMTVIRTLSTSDSNEQRDQERSKLEKDFKKSNQQLQELVYTHHDDLTRVMNVSIPFVCTGIRTISVTKMISYSYLVAYHR